jgi:uncharacterized protein (TIGR02246 family)
LSPKRPSRAQGTLSAGCGSTVAPAQSTAATTPQEAARDRGEDAETAARDLYERLLVAWNGQDAESFAAPFGEDGAMIGFDGSQAAGRQDVFDHLSPIFQDHPTGHYVAKVTATRTMGDEHVMLSAMVGTLPPGQSDLNPAVSALQTLVAERHDDGWRLVLLQTTPAQYHGRPHLVEEHTAALRPQVASGTTLT